MEHRAFCLYLFAVVNILKYSIVRKMPAVAGSKKGKKTTEAKAATVEEKEESQLQVRTSSQTHGKTALVWTTHFIIILDM